MERRRWTLLLVVTVALILMAGFALPSRADEISLKVIKGWGNKVAIEMENKIPVMGVEFILKDQPDVLTVKKVKPISRTEEFFVHFNDLGEKGVKVTLVSFKGEAIPPGSGPILKIIYQGSHDKKVNLELTGVKVADSNNQLVKVNLAGTSF